MDSACNGNSMPVLAHRPAELGAASVNLEQLHVKRQRGIGRDYTPGSLRAVSEGRWDDQLALSPTRMVASPWSHPGITSPRPRWSRKGVLPGESELSKTLPLVNRPV